MSEFKICPILRAGTMLERLHTTTQYHIRGEIKAHLSTIHHSAECMGEDCAWYENGCPAYPSNVT